jgi:hypothetical protein
MMYHVHRVAKTLLGSVSEQKTVNMIMDSRTQSGLAYDSSGRILNMFSK